MCGGRGNRQVDDRNWRPGWPRYVRLMAVAYVASFVVGLVGFLLLGGLAAAMIAGEGFRPEVVAVLAAAIACPTLCFAYRRWCRAWGRRRWPDGKPDR